ncbi:intermembrane phospholipid transport protein YdbH family protein [Marinobacterium arenosum]|uniref:intermembrane phospholipid transport protein YdbH family protein n=1 Tax=Marinobacterium arenosum TaxID=2862496 RepID=UPI001C966BBA|nr:YdbH domain-containing protein [Marinobacterium arenosum]MBY4676345.1 YdbH domain-containing protein [Marinobacterium arenosum]
MRRLLIGCLVLLLAVTLGYALLPYAARQLVELWLTEQGFQQARFSISHPAWNELRIKHLQLSRQRDERRLAVDAGPILIRYQPLQLLLERRLSEIQIPRARLELHSLAERSQPLQGELALLPLLPGELIGRLPAERLQIGQLDLHFSQAGQPYWRITGAFDLTRDELIGHSLVSRDDQPLGWSDFYLNRQSEFHWQLRRPDQPPLLQLNGRITTAPSFQLELAPILNLAELSPWLATLQRSETDTIPLTELNGSLTASGVVKLPERLQLAENQWQQQLTANGHFEIKLQGRPTATEIERLKLNASGQLTLDAGQFGASLATDSQLQLTPSAALSQLGGPLLLTSRQPIELQAPLSQPDQARVGEARLQLQLPPIKLDQISLAASDWQLATEPLQLTQPRLHGRLSSERLQLLPAASQKPLLKQWPELHFSSHFNASPEHAEQQYQLKVPALALQLDGKAGWHTADQRLDLSWQLQPRALKGIEKQLANYLPTLPAELSIQAGTLNHRGQARWQAGTLNASSRQNVERLQARWDKMELQQGHWQSRSRLTAKGSLIDQGRFNARRLDIGLPLTELRTGYRFYRPPSGNWQLELQPSELQLLGGRASLAALNYTRRDDSFHSTLTLDQLQLAGLLALEQQPGLTGQGVLSGTVPIDYQQGKFRVSDGQIRSHPPGGWIRFQPDQRVAALAASQPSLGLALQALENFQYQQLEVGINYQPDGTTLLNTRLSGHNPDWNAGQPVNFNLNIEENLPQLIKTLQITDRLTKSIEKRYR